MTPEQELMIRSLRAMDLNTCNEAADLIEQMAQAEPVAWRDQETGDFSLVCRVGWQPLYTAPPAREPLSDEQIRALVHTMDWPPSVREIVRAVEQAHGIRGEK